MGWGDCILYICIKLSSGILLSCLLSLFRLHPVVLLMVFSPMDLVFDIKQLYF